MKWWVEHLIFSATTFFACLFAMVVISMLMTSSDDKNIIVKLGAQEQVEGMATLKCDSIDFHLTQFSVISRTGNAVIDQAQCVLIKQTANESG